MAELDQAIDAVFSDAEAPQEPKQPEQPQEAPQEDQQPQEEPQPAPEQPGPVPPQESEAKHTVPLPKFLDVRDELKDARKRIQELEAKTAPKADAPDPFDDPQGFAAHQKSEVQQALTAQKFELSDIMARDKHGDEKVDAAAEWALQRAQDDPVFAAQYMRERNPIDWIVRQHQREGLVSQLPSDVSSLDELIEREIAKRGLTAAPATEAQPQVATPQPAPKPAAPRPSLVTAPSGAGVTHVPTGPVAGVEAVFPR